MPKGRMVAAIGLCLFAFSGRYSLIAQEADLETCGAFSGANLAVLDSAADILLGGDPAALTEFVKALSLLYYTSGFVEGFFAASEVVPHADAKLALNEIYYSFAGKSKGEVASRVALRCNRPGAETTKVLQVVLTVAEELKSAP